MRGFRIKDALIGAFLTALLFVLIGATSGDDHQERIATAFHDTGGHAILITDKGSVILVAARKGVTRGDWITVEVDEVSTNNVKRLLSK